MSRESARARTRNWILVNYAACVVVVVLPLLAKTWDLVALWVGVLLGVVAVLALSYTRAFGRTGLWWLTHAKPERLDERERDLTHTALATAYRWMAVVSLVAMYGIILAHDGSLGAWLGWFKPMAAPLALALIYFAHTLPAALIGWVELPPEADGGWQPRPAS